MDIALKDAEARSKVSDDGSRGFNSSQGLSTMTSLLSQLPGTADLARQAADLQAMSDVQERTTAGPPFGSDVDRKFAGPPGSQDGPPGPNIPGTNIDPMKTAAQIYPILEFRDRVVKLVNATIEKIPGLEALVEKISETLTLFVLSLLAPFIRPIINAVSAQLKAGSVSHLSRSIIPLFIIVWGPETSAASSDMSSDSSIIFKREILTPKSIREVSSMQAVNINTSLGQTVTVQILPTLYCRKTIFPTY